MANDLIKLTNSEEGYSAEVIKLSYAGTGNITASLTGVPLAAFPCPVRVVDVVLSVRQNGVDNTNPLSLTANVQKQEVGSASRTSTLSTSAAIDKAAGANYRSSVVSGAGITQAVVSTTEDIVPADSLISLDLAIVRTASPGTEIAYPLVDVYVAPQSGADGRDYTQDGTAEFPGL